MKVTTFENEYYLLTVKNGIMRVTYKENVTITLPIAKKMVADRIEFQKSIQCSAIPVIGYLNIKYANKAARKYLSLEGIEGISAAAFVSKTLAISTLVKVFVMVEQPKIPVRLFEDEKKALKWIKTFINK